MNFKKLAFWTTLFTTAAVPLATAQNPVILQGNYVSNVFGQSNFVLNPNAQTNTANVTVSSATVTRSTTTPLVATSEFNITTSTATGYADWSTRTFDAGMKNQNCEARFSYRGFSVGSTKAQLVQNSLVVAELTLTASTDPRIASINFPCGDLSVATTFRLQQATASLTGTNEIGGIYVGLATNMANVAQAENVVQASRSTAQSVPVTTATTVVFNNKSKDSLGEYDTSTGIFKAKRAGDYLIKANVLYDNSAQFTVGTQNQIGINKNGSDVGVYAFWPKATVTTYFELYAQQTVSLAVGDEIKITLYQNTGTTKTLIASDQYNKLEISRFPSSSELVVTPERQNVWAAAKWTGGSGTTITTNTTSAVGSGFTGYTAYGKASTTAPTAMEMTVANIPPGAYKLTTNLQLVTQATAATVDCYIKVSDDGGSTYQITQGSTQTYTSAFAYTQNVGGSTFFNYTSFQSSKTFKVYIEKTAGTGECRAQYIGNNTNIILEPIDQPSNSALYVQGPVKAAGTGTDVTSDYQGFLAGTARTAPKGKTYSARSITQVTTSPTSSISQSLDPGIYWCSFKSVIDAAIGQIWYSRVDIDGNRITDPSDDMALTLGWSGWKIKTISLPVIISQTTSVQFNNQLSASNSTGAYHEMWCLKIN